MPSSLEARLAQWQDALRAQGYRLTTARVAVLRALVESERALDATQIFDLARQYAPRLGLVTVYRTLDTLLALGLVQKVHCAAQCARYAPAEPGHHHLLVCRQCGRVWHFSGDDLGALMQTVAGESGFQVEDHWLQLIGLCAECRAKGVEEQSAAPCGHSATTGVNEVAR